MLILMTIRRFHHLGQDWEAVATGSGHGVGVGFPPSVNRWGVILRSVSNPQQGEYRGAVSQPDPSAVSLNELHRLLEEVLTIAAIDRSRFKWRTVEGISKETGISVDRVRRILETTTEADIIQSDEGDAQGNDLFTTRDHFVRATGDFSRRYADVEHST
jgi:hypothetical protein